jgi:hypothetical protein
MWIYGIYATLILDHRIIYYNGSIYCFIVRSCFNNNKIFKTSGGGWNHLMQNWSLNQIQLPVGKKKFRGQFVCQFWYQAVSFPSWLQFKLYIGVGGDPNFDPNKKQDKVEVFYGQSKQNPSNCHLCELSLDHEKYLRLIVINFTITHKWY